MLKHFTVSAFDIGKYVHVVNVPHQKNNHQDVILGEVITKIITLLNHENGEPKSINTNSET